ncbi:MAG TPA: hypothetical protein VJ453_02900, partial [Terriglobales bacterium]|nr:hypothetical protein [Terriglobales bacterium]
AISAVSRDKEKRTTRDIRTPSELSANLNANYAGGQPSLGANTKITEETNDAQKLVLPRSLFAPPAL